jgi:hypothetical protein
MPTKRTSGKQPASVHQVKVTLLTACVLRGRVPPVSR